MRTWKPDFKKQKSNSNDYYDIYDPQDWGLIEASFTQQYGIRLRHESYMPWDEFCTLLSGLGSETPFGKMISIRSESDPEHLKQFTPEARRIRNSWLSKKAKELVERNPDEAKRQISELERSLAAAFGSKA